MRAWSIANVAPPVNLIVQAQFHERRDIQNPVYLCVSARRDSSWTEIDVSSLSCVDAKKRATITLYVQ